MAREVILRTWCDVCLAKDQNEEGIELPPLHLVPGKPRVVALCEVHRKELFDPLVELLKEHGQPVDPDGNPTPGVRGHYQPRRGQRSTPANERKLAEGGVPCPFPGCGMVSKSRPSLQHHTTRMHQVSLDTLEAAPPGEVETVAALPKAYECPDCERTFETPQGRGAHRARAHGYTSGQDANAAG
jgi:hypothetical protein